MSMKKILYAYNFNAQDLSHFLMESIMEMRDLGLAEVIFLQNAQFNGWIQAFSKREIKSNILVEPKLVLPKILEIAKKERVSLIVLHLDKKNPRGVSRSIIENLIKRASVPLLFINNFGKGQKTIKKALFDNVIIGFDWSPPSRNALNHLLIFGKMIKALEIVKATSAKLTVKDIREIRETLAKTREICLDRGIDAETHIYAGKTTEEIITAAKDYKASLIVLGSNSKNKFIDTMFTKNRSCAVMVKTNLPVLVVPSSVTI